MADPLACLRGAAIIVGIWNIIYACIQIGVMGWQTQEVKNLMGYWENREIPDNALIYSDFKARFPGLYGLYTETPERRRVNAMYPIVIISLILAIAHLPASCMLLYGAIKRRRNWLWPYFFTGMALIIMSTAYAVLWWSGDVFTEQLVMSVAEFVMSIALSAPGWIAVVFFYIRLNGQLQSGKPATRGGSGRRRSQNDVPTWRTEWPDQPPPELGRKLRRKSRERREKDMRRLEKESEKIERERRRVERERRREEEERRARRYQPYNNGNVDYYVPRPQEQSFPWNSPVPRQPEPEPPRAPPRKKTAAEVIENLYYEHYPEDMPKEVGALRREQH
ncbi:hypothetical protein PENTCL1PPCAC_13395 [Pristionchus entomophagus]|uniref:G protein-coupled receptor n=1 Tax=Pristionchus entomophagus TaxID=358040 RepID=A0AAV5T6R4_9BILA|nr:hypothetical protein PENTCL1PPCAC_13395 [Pristionchus entomophagus]